MRAGNFARQSELVRQLDTICGEVPGKAATDVLIASANGTFVDEAERAAAAKHFPTAALYTAKPALGRKCRRGWALAIDLRCAGIAHAGVAADFACTGGLWPEARRGAQRESRGAGRS